MEGLITQHTAGLDKCGVVFPIPEYNGRGITAYTASARAKGAPVYLLYTVTAGQQVTATTPANLNTFLAFAYEAVAAGQIGRFVLSGYNVPLLVDVSAELAANTALEVIASGTYLIDQGGDGFTTITVHAMLEDAITAAEVAADAALASPTGVILKNCTIPPNFPYKTIAAS